jgi:hypothetical protein
VWCKAGRNVKRVLIWIDQHVEGESRPLPLLDPFPDVQTEPTDDAKKTVGMHLIMMMLLLIPDKERQFGPSTRMMMT